MPPSLLAHIYPVFFFFLDAFYIGLRYRSRIFQYKTTDASRQPEETRDTKNGKRRVRMERYRRGKCGNRIGEKRRWVRVGEGEKEKDVERVRKRNGNIWNEDGRDLSVTRGKSLTYTHTHTFVILHFHICHTEFFLFPPRHKSHSVRIIAGYRGAR